MLLAVGMLASLAACGNAEKVNTSDQKGRTDMTDFDFSVFNNVEIIGINVSELSIEE